MRCGCNSAPWSCSWVAVLLRLARVETSSWTASSVAASSPLSDPEGTAADDGCEVPPLDETHWSVKCVGRVRGGLVPPSTSSNPRQVASILQTLHTVTVRRAIQDLYSIHNPGHDNTRLLTKYRDSLEELLAAVRASAYASCSAAEQSSTAVPRSLFWRAEGWFRVSRCCKQFGMEARSGQATTGGIGASRWTSLTPAQKAVQDN
jgi:hypothetical protein